MRGRPLVKRDVACRLAKSTAFAIGDFGHRALTLVHLALVCGVSGDAVEGVV